jgi:serine protease Do
MAIAELLPPVAAPVPPTPSIQSALAGDAAVATAILGDVSTAAAAVAERVRASVVEVHTPGGGSGAGTIWRRDGTIVTNNHVVARDRARITLADGRTFAGSVVARDAHNDLAILRVDGLDLPAVEVADAGALRAGEVVLAVGHPFGVRGALTIGVVHRPPRESGWRYRDGGQRELIQADVLLGPGNSGGPLVDTRGAVVGINAMVNGALALAVPSHLAQRLVDEPQVRPLLGVTVREVALAPAQAAQIARFGAGAPPAGSAVLVVDVELGSAAEEGGVLVGDVLIAFGGEPLAGVETLPAALAAIGQSDAPLVVLRGTMVRDLVVRPRPPAAERRGA